MILIKLFGKEIYSYMWTRLIYFVIKPLVVVVVVLSRLIRDGIIINSKFLYDIYINIVFLVGFSFFLSLTLKLM